MEEIPLDLLFHKFDIRMVDLFPVIEPPHLSGKDQLLSFLKTAPEVLIVSMKPFQCDDAASVAHHDLKHPLSPNGIEGESAEKDFTKTRLLSSGLQFGYFL